MGSLQIADSCSLYTIFSKAKLKKKTLHKNWNNPEFFEPTKYPKGLIVL